MPLVIGERETTMDKENDLSTTAKEVFNRAKMQATNSPTSEQSETGKKIELCPYCGKYKQPCPIESCRNKAQFDSKRVESLQAVLVPPLYLESSERTFTGINLKAQERAEATKNGGIFLTGATGTGKTTLGTAIFVQKFRDVIGKDYGALWTTMGNILADIRNTYQQGSNETEKDIMKKYSEYPLLFIDDLGAEKVSDWSISALYSILSTRINYMRYTIVTSNLSLSDINNWEARIASRLAGLQVHIMAGSDRRVK